MNDEILLIDRAQKGDVDAFGQLVDQTKGRTYQLAYDLTGNRHDAEDVMQDAYIRAFRGLDRFRREAKLTTWLHRITVNTFMDHKRAKKDKHVEYDEEMENATNPAGPTLLPNPGNPASPDSRAEAEMIQQNIEQALTGLSPQERSVFVLRHYQDLPLKEIASVMDIAEGTVKAHLFRAIRRLQKALHFYKTDFGLKGRS